MFPLSRVTASLSLAMYPLLAAPLSSREEAGLFLASASNPESQVPVSNRASGPYQNPPGTCRTCKAFTHRGVEGGMEYTRCIGTESNRQSKCEWFTATGAHPCPADAMPVAQTGVEPVKSRRFELRRFACLRTAPDCAAHRARCPASGRSKQYVPGCQTPPAGFEPATSCVTGKRALRCSTRADLCR